jgi:hypothetical protein
MIIWSPERPHGTLMRDACMAVSGELNLGADHLHTQVLIGESQGDPLVTLSIDRRGQRLGEVAMSSDSTGDVALIASGPSRRIAGVGLVELPQPNEAELQQAIRRAVHDILVAG